MPRDELMKIDEINEACFTGVTQGNCLTGSTTRRAFNSHKKLEEITKRFCCLAYRRGACKKFKKAASTQHETCNFYCQLRDNIARIDPLISGCCNCVKEEEKCRRGFRLNKSTKRCEDIDECRIKNNGCESSQNCVNSQGSFSCIPRYTCRAGFHFSQGKTLCYRNKKHTLRCPSGYRFDRTLKSCVDIDECRDNRTICAYKCRNTEGSFHCLYQKDLNSSDSKNSKKHVNKSTKDQKFCADKICNDLMGGQMCHKSCCPEGYMRSNATKRNDHL